MQTFKRVAIWLDELAENIALTMLLAMVLIVVLQVFTRKFFNIVFFWSEEMTLLLLGWFTYMGIAIGFREHLHLEMDMIESLVPKKAISVLDKVIQLATFAFGAYLIYYGIDFCIMLMDSTMPATKLPNATIYAVLPVTGVFICIYSTLQFIGIDTKRYKDEEEEITEEILGGAQ